jgi:hypothetical protein
LLAPDQVINVEVGCKGACPSSHDALVLHTAELLVSDALTQGFCLRLVGRIRVVLESSRRGTALIVTDDGWERRSDNSCKLCIVRKLIAPVGGRLTLSRKDGFTAEILLPLLDARVPRPRLSQSLSQGKT